ncbi:MAG: hypothetical protein ACREBE_07735, partial [bacterium]
MGVGVALAVAMTAARTPIAPVDERLRATYTARLDSLAHALDMLRSVAARHGSHGQLASAQRSARVAYKNVEGLLEYFDGMTASYLNGRENAEADADDALDAREGAPIPETVTGFAGIEADLGDSGAVAFADIERRALLMARRIRSARTLAKHH